MAAGSLGEDSSQLKRNLFRHFGNKMAAVKMFGDELVTRGTSFVRDYTLHTKRQRLIKFFKIVHMMSVHVIQDFADSNFELISIGYVGLLT